MINEFQNDFFFAYSKIYTIEISVIIAVYILFLRYFNAIYIMMNFLEMVTF